MSKQIVFYNYYHNGDIHLSRGFVRQIINKVRQIDPTVQFSYAHRNAPSLLSDIPNLGTDLQALIYVNDHSEIKNVGDITLINTWYGQQRFRYMNNYGVSFDTLYNLFDDACKTVWNFSLSDISNDPSFFFPVIDYDKFYIDPARSWLNNHPGKKIFVSNGQALSGQSHNFDISSLVENLAKKYPDKTFILTNREQHVVNMSNVFYTENIIQKGQFDLNENAYISEHCDVLIGRASGALSFATTYNNMFRRNCKFLYFTNMIPQKSGKFWLSNLMQDRIAYSSEVIVTNESNTGTIQDLMEKQIL